ncbi:hypothetical protein ACFLUZ_04330 [Chloroflexota bacterium]
MNLRDSNTKTEVKRTIKDKAFISLLKTLGYVITGQFHRNKERIGELIKMDDGQEYIVFRQVIIGNKNNPTVKPEAILRIRFTFAHGSPKQNKLLSIIPIPFIVGLPGFRSKTWALERVSGGFQGIYEWNTIKDAETYKSSLAVKLMTRRAIPASVKFELSNLAPSSF